MKPVLNFAVIIKKSAIGSWERFSKVLGEKKITIDTFSVSPERLSGLIQMIDKKEISKKIAKEQVFPLMVDSEETATDIVARLGLKVESDDSILVPIVLEAIAKHPKVVDDIQNGKGKAISALIGYCMKQTKGKADPAMISELVQNEFKGIEMSDNIVDEDVGTLFRCELCDLQRPDPLKDKVYCENCSDNLHQAYQWLQSPMMSSAELKKLAAENH